MKYITIPKSNDYKVWYNKDYYVDKSGELLKLEGTLEGLDLRREVNILLS